MLDMTAFRPIPNAGESTTVIVRIEPRRHIQKTVESARCALHAHVNYWDSARVSARLTKLDPHESCTVGKRSDERMSLPTIGVRTRTDTRLALPVDGRTR